MGREARSTGRRAGGPLLGPLLLLLALGPTAVGSTRADPCPAHLFLIERSKNKNIVVYDANRGPAGDLDASEPVVAYWLLNGEADKREELNRVERERAYGVDVTRGDSAGTYSMVFKAQRKRDLSLRTVKGCLVVTTSFGGRDGILRRLFVKSKDDSALPKVEYVEIFGKDMDKGEPLYEKLLPPK